MSLSPETRVAAVLHRVLGWLADTEENSTGALICPVHRMEHTGKSAGALLLAVELMRHASMGNDEFLFAFSRRVALRIASRLEREGDSTCFTFRPGRHDPYNCSNSVIDGAAATDALAAFVMLCGSRLDSSERETLRHAAVLHAQTYLRYCIVDKGIPAQCAWAMTGAAQAFRLSDHEVLRFACEAGAERIRSVQRADGSVPYHPVEWGAEHPGAADASAFYQSRVHAFTAFALETTYGQQRGAELDTGFEDGVHFLHGLQGPDGIKTIGVEAKPWYWRSAYEVASHPFDIAAFAAEWRRTGSERAAAALAASWRAWESHVAESGEPRSHLPAAGSSSASTRSYQCPFFWAAHASWIARSLPELSAALGKPVADPGLVAAPRVAHFPAADLARLDTPRFSAWVRGQRPPGSAFHGSPVGGLLRVHDRELGQDIFRAEPFLTRPGAAWSGARGTLYPLRGWRAGREELRFSLWLARNRRRTHGLAAAVLEPLRALRKAVMEPAGGAVSTAFDRGASLRVEQGAIRWSPRIAFRTGDVVTAAESAEFELRPGGVDGLMLTAQAPRPRGVRGSRFRAPRAGVSSVHGGFTQVRFGEGVE